MTNNLPKPSAQERVPDKTGRTIKEIVKTIRSLDDGDIDIIEACDDARFILSEFETAIREEKDKGHEQDLIDEWSKGYYEGESKQAIISTQAQDRFLDDLKRKEKEHDVEVHKEAVGQCELLEDKMDKIMNWINAYPLDVFPEPDMKKACAILKEHEMTLDAISASNMRHVLEGIRKLIDNEPSGDSGETEDKMETENKITESQQMVRDVLSDFEPAAEQRSEERCVALLENNGDLEAAIILKTLLEEDDRK